MIKSEQFKDNEIVEVRSMHHRPTKRVQFMGSKPGWKRRLGKPSDQVGYYFKVDVRQPVG
jgi:hypothetical protein